MSRIDTGTGELLLELEDGVATITLNRPEKRNALSDNLTPALRQALLDLDVRSDVRCVVITGAGRAFCAGGDVSGMGSRGERGSMELRAAPRPSLEDAVTTLRLRQETLTLRLHELSKPTIASLPGLRPAPASRSRWRAICGSRPTPLFSPRHSATSACPATTARAGFSRGWSVLPRRGSCSSPAVGWTRPKPSVWASSTRWCRSMCSQRVPGRWQRKSPLVRRWRCGS